MKYKEDKISSFNIKKLILSNINLQISNFFKMLLKYAQPPKIFRLCISIKQFFIQNYMKKTKKSNTYYKDLLDIYQIVLKILVKILRKKI